MQMDADSARDVIAQPPARSIGWRLFAILVVFVAIRIRAAGWLALLVHPTLIGTFNLAVISIGVTGIVGFAFGFRVGSLIFWRVVIPPILVFAIWHYITTVRSMIGEWQATSDNSLSAPNIAAIIVCTGLVGAVCFALLRYAQLIGRD